MRENRTHGSEGRETGYSTGLPYPYQNSSHNPFPDWDYLDAMGEAGCDTEPMNRLLLHLKQGESMDRSLQLSGLPEEALCFTRVTMQLIQRPLHVRVAVFFHAREDLIPQMFVQMVEELNSKGLRCNKLLNYLRRHIETDRDRHGPLAERLLTRLRGDDAARREEAAQAAIEALKARLALWDATIERLDNKWSHQTFD